MSRERDVAAGSIAVLGFQYGWLDSADSLARDNAELATAILGHEASTAEPVLPGLLRYQTLRQRVAPDRFCVYWQWSAPGDRDSVWAHPPVALRRYWSVSDSFWKAKPLVSQYVGRSAPWR